MAITLPSRITSYVPITITNSQHILLPVFSNSALLFSATTNKLITLYNKLRMSLAIIIVNKEG